MTFLKKAYLLNFLNKPIFQTFKISYLVQKVEYKIWIFQTIIFTYITFNHVKLYSHFFFLLRKDIGVTRKDIL